MWKDKEVGAIYFKVLCCNSPARTALNHKVSVKMTSAQEKIKFELLPYTNEMHYCCANCSVYCTDRSLALHRSLQAVFFSPPARTGLFEQCSNRRGLRSHYLTTHSHHTSFLIGWVADSHRRFNTCNSQ
jgi:hypothetical protein